MSTSDDSAALSEIKELVAFVNHPNGQVRVQAAKMVTSLSALESNLRLIAQTDLIPAMAKQMTATKEISREIFKALINFGESEEIYIQMMKANMISISMEVLRDPSTDLEMRELILMFLVNMTRDEKGASLIMQEGEEVEGLHVRRLFNWFVQNVPTTNNKSQLDPNAYCAHILTNISQIPAGRRLIMNRERGFLAQIKPQLASSSDMRRLGCFQLVKNCFMEESNHAYLLSQELGIWPLVLLPIIGNEPFLHGEDEYKGILPEVRAMMTETKRRDKDPQVRVLVYEIILLCAKYKPSRVLLRSQAIYPILRHAHDAEKESKEHELDELLEQLVPFFILDEDDAQHPDAKEADKRRQRVEQLKQMNAAEEAAGSSDSKKAASEPVDQPVHYLGDELGGSVRANVARTAADVAAANIQPVQASAALPPEPVEEDFPAMEPIGAEETAALGEVEHNIKTISLVKAEAAEAAAKANAPVKEIVYAQPEAQDDEDDDLPDLRDEDEEEQYMNALD